MCKVIVMLIVTATNISGEIVYSSEGTEREYDEHFSRFLNEKTAVSHLGFTTLSNTNLDGFLCGNNMEFNKIPTKNLNSTAEHFVCKCEEDYIDDGYHFCKKNDTISSPVSTNGTLESIGKMKYGSCDLQGTTCGENLIYTIRKHTSLFLDGMRFCEILCYCSPHYVLFGDECKHERDVFDEENITTAIQLTSWSIVLYERFYDKLSTFCGYNALHSFEIVYTTETLLLDGFEKYIVYCRCEPGYKRELNVCVQNSTGNSSPNPPNETISSTPIWVKQLQNNIGINFDEPEIDCNELESAFDKLACILRKEHNAR